MGRRLFLAPLLLALVLAASASASVSKPSRSWAAPEIRAVTAAGLMGATDPASFRPDDTLTAQMLENLAFEVKQRVTPPEVEPLPAPEPVLPTDPTATTTTTGSTPPPAAPKQVPVPDKPVTIAQLDLRLVQSLGLGKAANQFTAGARAAGLEVAGRLGTEVVARLLGLRTNHPASEDSLELRPNDPATRAEAAFSTAQILRFSGWEVAAVQGFADTFELPAFTDWQKRILTTAFAKVGMPYIWGGESDGPQVSFGVSSRGGYDCSGFVWRVYKHQPYPNEGALASVLRGRTTYQMSGELPKSQRLGLDQLEPADVIFFGDRGPRSRPSQVGHMAIYVGNGWFVHSSGYGVALARLDGWYARQFAWARRPLAEAALA